MKAFRVVRVGVEHPLRDAGFQHGSPIDPVGTDLHSLQIHGLPDRPSILLVDVYNLLAFTYALDANPPRT